MDKIKLRFAKILLWVINKTIGLDFFVKNVGWKPLIETGLLKPYFIGTSDYDVRAKLYQSQESVVYWKTRWYKEVQKKREG